MRADVLILKGEIVRVGVITAGASAFLNTALSGVVADGTLRSAGERAEIVPAVVNYDVVVNDAVVVEAATVIGSNKYAGLPVFKSQVIDKHHLRRAMPRGDAFRFVTIDDVVPSSRGVSACIR